jgi:hypothetical protein
MPKVKGEIENGPSFTVSTYTLQRTVLVKNLHKQKRPMNAKAVVLLADTLEISETTRAHGLHCHKIQLGEELVQTNTAAFAFANFGHSLRHNNTIV